MAKKEFTFQGKNLEEVKSLTIEEFTELLPTRERRSIKRGFTNEQKIFLKKLDKKKVVKTHCRDMIILPSMIERTILVHSGKQYVSVTIIPEMIGHRLGEFALTRNNVKHSSPGVGATRSSSAVSVR